MAVLLGKRPKAQLFCQPYQEFHRHGSLYSTNTRGLLEPLEISMKVLREGHKVLGSLEASKNSNNLKNKSHLYIK